MPTITLEPATQDRFTEVERALTGGGDGASCQCQWWLMTSREFDATSRADKEERLRIELANSPSAALIAFVDGEAAGWVRVGPRTAQPRLARTRTFAASPRAWHDETVWAVSCFVVRREHRGAGLMAALLAAAVDHARANGARMLEAYPIDTSVGKRPTNDLYTGVLSVFLAAGFREVARPKPHRAIVELDLSR